MTRNQLIVSHNDDIIWWSNELCKTTRGTAKTTTTNHVISCLSVALYQTASHYSWLVFSASSLYKENPTNWPYRSYQSIIPSEQYLIRSTVLIGTASSSSCQHSRISFLEISDILFAANNLLPLQEPIRLKIHCFCHCSIITTWSINPL